MSLGSGRGTDGPSGRPSRWSRLPTRRSWPPSLAGRRGLALAVGLTAAGAAGVLFAGSRPLLQAADGGPVPDAPSVGGPLAASLGLVGLAAAGALLLVGRRGRRLLGALVTVAALALLADRSGDGAGWFAYTAGTAPAPTSAAWPWVLRVAAAVLGLGGLLALVAAGRWPAPAGRYQRGAGTPARARPVAPERAQWDALDRGEDPTA